MSQDYGHDPALCQSPVCSWYDAFNYGYAVGKARRTSNSAASTMIPLRSTEASRARSRTS